MKTMAMDLSRNYNQMILKSISDEKDRREDEEVNGNAGSQQERVSTVCEEMKGMLALNRRE
jgi:hypothetical protein